MNFQEHINEIKDILRTADDPQTSSEDKRKHVMLAMDKMITFGHNETFKKKFRDKSAIRLFEAALYKAKEYTTIDKRFEKYIGVFENLVRKLEIRLEKYIKKEEQRKNDEQVKRIEKELRTKRELARLKWTLSEKPTEKQKEQEKKKEQRLERELARLEWTMLS